MANLKGYNFKILIEDKELDVYPTHIKFSIRDSIHELFPRAIISFVDSFGIVFERSFILDGTNIKIDYGFNKDEISCPFNVASEESTEIVSSTYISGGIQSNLKHNYHWTEQIISKIYKQQKISEIINTIFSQYQFTKRTIIDTNNKLDWYQPLIKNSDFIYKILLPNAYSPKSNDTPYFCFINSNNEINFTTYNEMIRINPKVDLVFSPQNKKVPPNQNITRLDQFITGNDITDPVYYNKTFEIDPTDGSLIEKNFKLIDFPKTFPDISNIRPPMQVNIKRTDELYKSYQFLPPAKLVGHKDNNKGRQLSYERDAFFLERFRLILPLNLKLLAGKTINMDIMTSTKSKSIRFNGNYVIETCEHIWNGNEGTTILTIGRKNYKVLNTYEGSSNVWGRTH
jgi:hypothetical protein